MEYVHSTAEAKALVLEEMFLEYGGGILYDAGADRLSGKRSENWKRFL